LLGKCTECESAEERHEKDLFHGFQAFD